MLLIGLFILLLFLHSLVSVRLEQLGVGVLVGAVIGWVGGSLIARARRHGWMSSSGRQLAVVALPVLCLLLSLPLGASAFIAAFVAGLAVQPPFPEASRHSLEFTEGWGRLFTLAVFFLFGLLLVKAWPGLGWRHLLYGLLSLTLIRMLPVALALRGTGLSWATTLFMGWFGPRGLASVVLARIFHTLSAAAGCKPVWRRWPRVPHRTVCPHTARLGIASAALPDGLSLRLATKACEISGLGLVYLEQGRRHSGEETIRMAVVTTVALSIVCHGMSAIPGMEWYARAIHRLPAGAPELESDSRSTTSSRQPITA